MNTLSEQYNDITEEQLKTVAVMLHDDEWKISNGVIFDNDDNIVSLLDIEEHDSEDWNSRFICLTDDEADEKAKEYILDSVWAFNASFLASFTGFDIAVFEAIQNNGCCESNNNAILSMIEDEDEFVAQAIAADGRAHFLNTYDGHEHEVSVNDEFFYVYRMH